ncbi:hypothetical protein BROUX41_005165 [Berkeleyomyces rouxiae]|uniref:uncharacterized protein n=1 Tax=Berkeleyomyces rouxiae TaxID=2035830 RepID=UPI003B78A1A3
MQFSFAVAGLLALANAAWASSPACLVSAVVKQPEPTNLDLVCSQYQSAVLGNLTETCSSEADAQDAYKRYASDCEQRNFTVASMPPYGSSDDSEENSSSTDSDASAAATASSANASGTSSGSASSSSVSTAGAASLLSSRDNALSAVMAAGIAGLFL